MYIVDLNKANIEIYIAEIVKIHLKSFPKGHFTSTFSIPVLTNYYRYLFVYSAISFLIYDGNVRGYLIAGPNIHIGVKKFIKKYFIYVFIKYIYDIFSQLSKLSLKNKYQPRSGQYRLYVIASQVKGNGYGSFMLKNLESKLKCIGINNYGLSVRSENINAINFYLKNGFSCAYKNDSKFYLEKVIL